MIAGNAFITLTASGCRAHNFLRKGLDTGYAQVIMPESVVVPAFQPGSRILPTLGLGVNMSVLDLCDSDAAAVSLDATVADAIRTMLDHHVGAVAVVDSEKRVAGIFTERDVLRKLALSGRDPEKTPVRELMTTPVELATLATGPGEALATMIDRHFRHLPVADNQGKLLGMVSIRNVLQWRIDDLSQELDSLEQYVANDGPGG